MRLEVVFLLDRREGHRLRREWHLRRRREEWLRFGLRLLVALGRWRRNERSWRDWVARRASRLFVDGMRRRLRRSRRRRCSRRQDRRHEYRFNRRLGWRFRPED